MNSEDIEDPGRSLFEVLRRRRAVAIITFLIVALASLAFVSTYKVKYAAISQVVLVNDMNGRDPSAAGVDMPTIVTGSAVLEDVRRQLRLADSVGDLRKAVNARIAPKSSLMTISVQNRNPQTAIAINNAVAGTFTKLYRQLAGSRYENVAQRLTGDFNRARVRLGTIERRLEVASADASYVGSQASLDASAAHLAELKENRGLALAQLTADRANLKADREQPGKTAEIVRHEILMNNPAFRETELRVARDLAQYTAVSADLSGKYPGVEGFRDKVQVETRALESLRAEALAGRDAYSPSQGGQIVQSARDQAAVEGDQVKLGAFDLQIRGLKERLEKPIKDVPSIGGLRAERDAAEAQLQALSQRLSNAQANSAESSSLGEVVVVDRATEARPTLVGPKMLFELGLLAAVLLSIAAAYLAELLVPRLLGSSDVEGVYGRPILATFRSR